MPIYDYRCSDCGKTYDVFHKVREVKEDVVCPHCHSSAHLRLISAPSIRVKGRGAYDAAPAPSCADLSCCGGECAFN